jgi:hypothetical protein
MEHVIQNSKIKLSIFGMPVVQDLLTMFLAGSRIRELQDDTFFLHFVIPDLTRDPAVILFFLPFRPNVDPRQNSAGTTLNRCMFKSRKCPTSTT